MTYPNGYAGDLDVESMAAELRLAQRQRDEAVTNAMDLSSQLAQLNLRIDSFRETLEETRADNAIPPRGGHHADRQHAARSDGGVPRRVRRQRRLPQRADHVRTADTQPGVRGPVPVTVTFTVTATSVENAEDEARPDMRRIESAIDNFSLYNASAVTSSVEYDDADIEINDSY
jgi:hypothetical protein